MSRITNVELSGFKGRYHQLDLAPLQLLSGPNGLGKSAVLEGIRYALSGEVPSGKALDAVALYFGPRGGHVTVTDAGGAWIRRGIERDHEKKKVSEILEEEGDAEWSANTALLDMKGFLALSPNKRREFVLELVGAGETPGESEVHKALATYYAREIGGAGADVSLLDGRREDLPPELERKAAAWQAIWGVLQSYLKTGEQTASAVFQRLADAANDRRKAAAVAEKDSAKRELEAAAKGAEAAAAELDERRDVSRFCEVALGEARAHEAARREAERGAALAVRETAELASRLELCEQALRELEEPGERPEAPMSVDKELRQKAEQAAGDEERVRQARMDVDSAEVAFAAAGDELELASKAVESVENEPLGRATFTAQKIRSMERPASDAFPIMGAVDELLELVDKLAANWKERSAAAAERMVKATEKYNLARERLDELAKSAPEKDDYRKVKSAHQMALMAVEKAEKENAERQRQHQQAIDTWQAKTRKADQVRAEQKIFFKRYEAAKKRRDELVERLNDIPETDVAELEEERQNARKALEAAEEAAGAVKAYRDAVARSEREKVAQAAWKAALAACRTARESYVADIVEPLVRDVQALLRAAGRSETVYLTLENDRGQPVFDLGWVAGESRRSLSALSGGEAVLFCAALALTIARRSKGRRVLLIEADPLDEDNLGALLDGLRQAHEVGNFELDAVLVATSTPVEAKEGWSVMRFGEEVAKTR